MLVFTINQHGEALMPCKPRKTRLLHKEKKAKIVKYEPFTIQLLYGSSGYTQPVNIGIDLGAKTTGIAVTTEDKVLVKGEVEVRQDVKKNLDTRRTYRRGRRQRKTRYRQSRFNNRKRENGWLPPSMQSRIANTFRWIDRFQSLLPESTLHIEVRKFDVQKMINPEIQGVDYQKGQTHSYHDVRYFVFARDKYTCQVCKKKDSIFYIKQFRKKKRSLHEATARKGRKEPNRNQRRNAKNTKEMKGFFRNDKVQIYGRIGFISGFTGTTMCYVKDVQGNYITKPEKSYKQVSLNDCERLAHNNNWQFMTARESII